MRDVVCVRAGCQKFASGGGPEGLFEREETHALYEGAFNLREVTWWAKKIAGVLEGVSKLG